MENLQNWAAGEQLDRKEKKYIARMELLDKYYGVDKKPCISRPPLYQAWCFDHCMIDEYGFNDSE